MKKLCAFLAVFLIGAAHAAQTPVTEISGTQASIGALKSQTNSKLNVIEANRQDHESRVSAMESGKADQTAVNLKADIAGTVMEWTAGRRSYSVDDWVTYDGKIFKCLSANTSDAGNAPGVGGEWEEFQGGGGSGSTNISVVAGANTVAINSSSGTDATFPAATTIAAGAMTAADKTKLDGIAPSATANSSDATLLARANHTGTQAASTISDFAATVTSTMSSFISKLNGIQSGAEVNVNADWNASSGDAQILNKPSVVATNTDNTYTGQQTFEDIVLPKFNDAQFNLQANDDGCTSGVYSTYFTAAGLRKCINGTASDAGSGGSMTWPGAGIAVSSGSSSWSSSLSLDTDLSSTSSNDDSIPSAKAVRSAIDAISASGIPSVTETPADAATGAAWYNSTANEFCVAEAAGISCVAMTYTADDNDPSNSTPWFTDETDIATGTAKVSNAITLAGLGARGAAVSVTGSTGAGYNKNSAGCTSSAGRVYNGDTLAACVTASSSNNTATTATLTAGTDSDTYSVTTVAGSAYLINQDFDGAGYSNSETWAETGTPDEDYTSTVLRGSQSFYSASGSNNALFTLGTEKGELWAHIIYRVTGTFTSDTLQLLQFQDSSHNQLALVGVQDSSYYVRFWQTGASGTSLASNITAGNTYHLWVHIAKGATSTVEVWNGTSTTRPTSSEPNYATSSGTWNVDVKYVRIGQGGSSGSNVIIDQVIVDDEEFTTVD